MNKLYRSARNRRLTGLIGGISENLGLSTMLLRIIFFISIFATGGTSLLIYFIVAMIVPKESNHVDPYHYGPNARGYK